MKLRACSNLSFLAAAVLVFVFHGSGEAGRRPEPVVLEGVSFAADSAALDKGSEAALQQLLRQLTAEPRVSIEIRCRVSASGDPARDAELGRQRAEVLRGWLMKRGIAFYRLDVAEAQTPAAESGRTPQQGRFAGDRVEIVRIHKSFPSAVAENRAFRFEPVVEGREVLHDFLLRNEGSAPLSISNVRTG